MIPWFQSKGCGILEQWGCIFFSFSALNNAQHNQEHETLEKNRAISACKVLREASFHGMFRRSQCTVVPAFLCYTPLGEKKLLLKATKTVVSMSRNEDRLNRPVYASRSVLSSAMTKPSRIPASFSDFCPQEGQQQNLCGFRMRNYFPPQPTLALHGAQACNSAWCFDSSQSSNLFQRSVQGKKGRQCSNWQTCPDNN